MTDAEWTAVIGGVFIFGFILGIALSAWLDRWEQRG